MATRGSESWGRWWVVGPLVAALLAGYYLMAVTATRQESCTFDELAHLTAGYSHWQTGQFRLMPENGNLPQSLAGAGLLGLHPRFPALDTPAWHTSNEFAIGSELFYHGGNDAAALLLRGRAAIALLGVALGLLVFFWSRELFGLAGGLLSLGLFAFCPSMLAHGGLVTSDMAATLFFPASLYALWKLLHRVSVATILCAGACLSGLFLSKMSAGLVVVMGLALLGVRLGRRDPLPLQFPGWRRPIDGRLRQAAVLAGAAVLLALLVWGAIWAAYGFRYSAFGDHPGATDQLFPGGWDFVLNRPGFSFKVIGWAREHQLLPESYLYGHAFVFHDAQARRAFLNGTRRLTGWWWFFPYCLAVKTPLALFGTLILAGAAVVWRWVRPALTPTLSQGERGPAIGRPWWHAAGAGAYATAPLWVLLAVYWAVSLASHLNIGQRHILPTYPAMFILAGAAGYWLTARRWWPAGLLVAMVVWFLAASLWVRPHYLAYFNELVGGPRQGYRHLVDSSLDWGQDLPGLQRYLVGHGLDAPGAKNVYLSYFGVADPNYDHIHARLLPCFFAVPDPDDALRPADALAGGCYCISATMLQSVYLQYPGAWTDEYERAYEQLVPAMAKLRQTMLDPAKAREIQTRWGADLARINFQYRDLSLGRLCAYLRHRPQGPDDEVGYSILIYNLSDEEVRAALLGPPAEYRTDPPELWPPRP
jgi:hypothetical protein